MAPTLILGIDGTLVDSNRANARAWVTTFRAQGLDVPNGTVCPLVGMGGAQLIPAASGIQQDAPRFKALMEGWKAAFSDELPSLRPFLHTREFVQAAQEAGWRTVVATSGAPDLAARLLDLAQVADLLPDRVSGEDTQASKPPPDLMHAVLEKVVARAEDAWMLADTV